MLVPWGCTRDKSRTHANCGEVGKAPCNGLLFIPKQDTDINFSSPPRSITDGAQVGVDE